MKKPYSFPARSRVAMIAAIQEISNPRGYNYKTFPFAWNVKLPYVPDSNQAARLNAFREEPGEFDAELDGAWQSEMEGEWFDYRLIEDMRRGIEDYSDYDGNDDFSLDFYGRQGGWLILEEAFGLKLAGFEIGDLHVGDEFDFPFIRKLYRALVVMDQDFARDKVQSEMLYQIAFMREKWEEDQRDAKTQDNVAFAAEMEAARPDMYASEGN